MLGLLGGCEKNGTTNGQEKIARRELPTCILQSTIKELFLCIKSAIHSHFASRMNSREGDILYDMQMEQRIVRHLNRAHWGRCQSSHHRKATSINASLQILMAIFLHRQQHFPKIITESMQPLVFLTITEQPFLAAPSLFMSIPPQPFEFFQVSKQPVPVVFSPARFDFPVQKLRVLRERVGRGS